MFKQIEKYLMEIEKPGRYIGNEAGIPDKDFKSSEVRMVISYPDVYEVGMSNYGIKILYDVINKLPFASCERVFSAWTDFEELLKKLDLPLFSLETKTPLNEFDVIGVSIQYELLFSNFLALLQSGKVPLKREERTENDPIVIIGGPASVNPVPYNPFIDLSCVGEGEEVLVNLMTKLRELKQKKLSRREILQELAKIDGIYSPDFTTEPVKRQIYMGFENDTGPDSVIIPNIDIVQNKLNIEIMRGCPNKCRFCQAGVIYKPYREKNTSVIMKSVEKGLMLSGVNEVTFTSLSSGDYSQILPLTTYFNEKYKSKKISVALPSLKVESFDIGILDKLSEVRKSGLTFAIESGSHEGQFSLNKRVDLEKIYQILDAAIAKGWRLVKFYFMIGLPDEGNDVENIKKFVDAVLERYKKLKINLNVATFVPKPHTPYQDVPQLSYEEAVVRIQALRDYYRKTRVMVKAHEPEISYIEGFISRGDEKVGLAVYEAFLRGARFDGWNEKFDFQRYLDVFNEAGIKPEDYMNGGRSHIWKMIDCLPSDKFLKKERDLSLRHEESKLCNQGCDEDCKICGNGISKRKAIDDYKSEEVKVESTGNTNERFRYFLEFTKSGLSRFLSHKDLMRHFETLFRIGNINLLMSEGFNPHPRFQFSSALSLGIESKCEILEFFTAEEYSVEELEARLRMISTSQLNRKSHADLKITRIRKCVNTKKVSIFNNLAMTEYLLPYDVSFANQVNDDVNRFNQQEKIIFTDERGEYDLKSFISLENVDKGVKFFVRQLNASPKIRVLISEIFPNVEFLAVIKEKMYKDLQKNDLFYLD